MVGGVCGGLAQYFNMDSTIVRLLFALLIVYGGAGLPLYIILWIVMPTESNIGGKSDEIVAQNTREIKETAKKVVKEVKTDSKKK